ncbi:PH domain-containing protein [Haloterrigena salifodinae]|uniref:PH domain-containing protein n=1 Tax=Haloterrigena salifodinae TaxID=2675099 RepID=A0A8T8E514_9EURY|nr:PH domain-containing protein [Haloterrigena salifodinae]QRV16858.1 PH domain-containing protein [Haloterrigena salifodinae]
MSQKRDGSALAYDEAETADRSSDRSSRTESRREISLLEGEEVLVDAQPTWWNWIGHAVGGGLAGLIGVLGLAAGSAAAGVLGIVTGLVIAGYIWYRRNRVRYLVTDRRLVVIAGFTARTTSETWMEDIRGLQTSTTAFSRGRGFGTVTVSHAVIPQGLSRTSALSLSGVPNYADVANTIRQRQSERKAGDY